MKNTTKLFIAAAFLSVGMASAQSGVGVGTTKPATGTALHVDGAKDNTSVTPTATQAANDVVVTSTGNVGIGTTTPDTSAALDVTSTTKGLLIPRMTTAQRTAIGSPAAGLQVYDTTTNTQWYYNGTIWVAPGTSESGVTVTVATTVVSPIHSTTGKIWMDRNLGALRKAQSLTDYLAYGQLYQWGRGNDGHADITWESATTGTPVNGTTTTLSATDYPDNFLFILQSASTFDWRAPQNDNLWQGVNGKNNPCPAGYRLPTATELNAEVAQYSITNSASAFASPLKFTVPGFRGGSTGALQNVGSYGYYWSSSVAGSPATARYFIAATTGDGSSSRAKGQTVRCLKD